MNLLEKIREWFDMARALDTQADGDEEEDEEEEGTDDEE